MDKVRSGVGGAIVRLGVVVGHIVGVGDRSDQVLFVGGRKAIEGVQPGALSDRMIVVVGVLLDEGINGGIVGAVLVVVDEDEELVELGLVHASLGQYSVPGVAVSEDEVLKRFKPTSVSEKNNC